MIKDYCYNGLWIKLFHVSVSQYPQTSGLSCKRSLVLIESLQRSNMVVCFLWVSTGAHSLPVGNKVSRPIRNQHNFIWVARRLNVNSGCDWDTTWVPKTEINWMESKWVSASLVIPLVFGYVACCLKDKRCSVWIYTNYFWNHVP